MANNSVQFDGDAMIEVIPVVRDKDGNITNKGVPVLMSIEDFTKNLIEPNLTPPDPGP